MNSSINNSHLLKSGGLALSAPNSINYLDSCLSQPDSWASKNYQLFNTKDSGCHCGWDEQCTLDLAVSNQPTCPHQLGTSGPKLPQTVFNIQYGTGAVVADPSPLLARYLDGQKSFLSDQS